MNRLLSFIGALVIIVVGLILLNVLIDVLPYWFLLPFCILGFVWVAWDITK
jgi:hypothetical protein